MFDLRTYVYEGFQARVGLSITLKHDGKEVFQNGYLAEGKSQGGKTFVGGRQVKT